MRIHSSKFSVTLKWVENSLPQYDRAAIDVRVGIKK